MADKRKNLVNYQHELFRKLTRLFSGPISTRRQQSPRHLKRFQLDKYSSRIKSTSGQEFKKSMRTPWEQFSHNFYAECNRHDRYVDFSQMEFTGECCSALDIYADEMTTASALREMLTIKCTNQEIKHVLQNLYYNIMNIEYNLFGWCRSMCKFGDFFLFLDIDEKEGISHVIGLPTEQVERLEGEDKNNPDYVQFQWNSAGLTIENWQMLHFRILGNDKFFPYGSCLSYDSKVYTQNGVKEIKDIVAGDIVISYDINSKKVITSNVLDKVYTGKKRCYRISTRHNFIDATKEHKVAVYDHEREALTYKFVDELKLGDLLAVKKTHETEENIGVIKEQGNNYKSSWDKVCNVPDYVDTGLAQLFGFMLGDGWISHNEITFSMGIYPELNDTYRDLIVKYSGGKARYLINPYGKTDRVTVCSAMLRKVLRDMGFVGDVYTKRLPTWIFSARREIKEAMLQGLYDSDGCCNVDKWNVARYQFELCNQDLLKDIKCLIQTLGYKTGKISSRDRSNDKPHYIHGRKINTARSYNFYYYLSLQAGHKKYTSKEDENILLEPIVSIEQDEEKDVYDIMVDNQDHNFFANGVLVHNSVLDSARRVWRQLMLLEDAMMAYRVVRSSERRVFYVDVAGIDPNDLPAYMEQVMSTMKRNRVVDQDTGRVDLRYNPMSVEEDYYIPVKGDSQTKIENLSGGQNTTAIDDVKYIRNKLFAALKIPAAYLSADGEDGGASEDKTTLSQKDIHFARTIQRLQKIVIAELEKAGIIHLFTLGFRGDDLTSFSLSLNNPSVIAELQELERWKSKFDVAAAATEGMFSKRWIATNLLGLSNEEFQRMQIERFYDKKIDAAVEASGEQAAVDAAPMGAGIDAAGGGMEGMTPPGEGGAGEPPPEEEEGLPVVPPSEEQQAYRSPQQLRQLQQVAHRPKNMTYLRGVHRGHGRDARTEAGPRARSYKNLAGLEVEEADPIRLPRQFMHNLGQGMITEGKTSIYTEDENRIEQAAGLVKLLEEKMNKDSQ